MKFFFVHINKTGGSSIEEGLRLPFRHLTAREVIADIGLDRWQRLYSFSFVRNPWDKVVSHYSYRVQTNQTNLGTAPIEFGQWVRETLGTQNRKYYDNPKMFMPQVDWLTDASGRMVVTKIGRFEALQSDFDYICQQIGRQRLELPRIKASTRGHYRDYYDAETRELVAGWFAADVRAFDYEF